MKSTGWVCACSDALLRQWLRIGANVVLSHIRTNFFAKITYMNNVPDYDAIVALHKKYAPTDDAFDLIFTHCTIVWEIAEQLIDKTDVKLDKSLVMTGCLLHDIGVYRLYLPDGTIDHKNYIKHGTLGDELLKEEGFNEELRRFASSHTGVGLRKQEIIDENLPLPHEDFLAHTPEEELVMYSDKFHTKSTPPKLMTAAAYEESVRKFGEDKVTKFKQFQQQFGVPDLNPVAQKYSLEIQDIS
jgi:uncharacterized protein